MHSVTPSYRPEIMAPSHPPLPSIPSSTSVVSVKLIDTGAKISGVKTSMLFENPMSSFTTVDLPTYAFLVEHKASGARILFDLGLRQDWEEGVPPYGKATFPDLIFIVEFTLYHLASSA